MDGARRLPTYVYPETMVGPNGSFVWYCIPKNASASLARMLSRLSAEPLYTLARAHDPVTWLRQTRAPAFSFAFVRHPFARLVSAWKDKIFQTGHPDGPPELFRRMPPGLFPGMPLNDFVGWLADNYARGGIDKHWRRQTDFVCDSDGLCVDYVGRIEDLDMHLQAIESRIGGLGVRLHKNESPNSTPDLVGELSNASRRIIRQIYRSDFERFGFEE